MTRRFEWGVAIAVATATAIYFAFIWKLDSPGGVTSYDTYQHFYPNILYLIDALRDGGRGALWNPYQSCGAPFFGTMSNGAAYPGNALFLVLGLNHAVLALAILNLTIGGVSTYALSRELGAGRLGAGSGAVAFQLSTGSVDVTTWAPMLGGAYAWLPASMLFCERTLRAPTLANAIGLAVALSLSLLPGFPQIVFFAYQLIALRVVWALLTQPAARHGRAPLLVGAGLIVAPLLAAVQLFPGLEMAGASMRGHALSADEVLGAGALEWARLRSAFTSGGELGNPFPLLPTLLGVNGLLRGATRRAAAFYGTAGILYFLLAFGNATPLYRVYVQLPAGALFRDPTRFLWITCFCFAILTALGVDAVARRDVEGSLLTRHGTWVFPGLLLVGFSFLGLHGLTGLAWALGLGMVVAAFAVLAIPTYRVALATAVAVLAGYGTLAFPVRSGLTWYPQWSLRRQPGRSLMTDERVMLSNADLFRDLRTRMTAQDRAYFVHAHRNFAFMPKTASLFRIPTVQNYEPQPTQRAAEYYVMLLSGQIMRTIGQFYYPLTHPMPPSLRRRLLDIAGVRYIVADATVDHTTDVMRPPPALIKEFNGLRVYENSQALPRARYVPRVEVVPDPQAQLLRLANGSDDLARLSLVENEPPTGFLGVAPYLGIGTVQFVTDDPEHLIIDVNASERGFLLLSDHYFPGWEARVNDAPVPIQPANFLFRLIEVPAGDSRVELRYRPRWLAIGASVSGLTIASLVVALFQIRRPIGRR